jgi:hopene-associated glycosyltransferase HpnB
MDPVWLAIPGLLIWSAVLLLPWRPWSTREYLDAGISVRDDLSSVTIIIPARNEAQVIGRTLASLARQGKGFKIILIDDQSTDRTAEIAAASGLENLDIIPGKELQPGWSGKLWALQQGLDRCTTEYMLLLDADIELQPGTLPALLDKMSAEACQLVSLMAFLRMQSFWEKMLMPAFIFFFKLLYPFRISNSESGVVAAAAGGCILIDKAALTETGGFVGLKNELIDDCALARRIKNSGYRTWIGLTHSAVSHRRYDDLQTIREMVTRTAFTQLHYSVSLLLLCTLLMLSAFVLPVIALFINNSPVLPVLTLLLMVLSYLPVLRFYRAGMAWAVMLPVTGLLYLAMTWDSALNHWRGKGSQWKDRAYVRQID